MSTPSKRLCPEGAVVPSTSRSIQTSSPEETIRPSTSRSSPHSNRQKKSQEIIVTDNNFTDSPISITQIQNNQNDPKKVENLDFEVQAIHHEIIGRDEDVHAVFDLLLEERDELKNRVVITGVGGKGKTTLALLCANEIRAGKNIKIKNVAFLRAASDAEFKTSIKGLASRLKIDKELPPLEVFKQIADLYKDESLLLVLDNLEELQVIKSVLDLPPNVYLLATSQDRSLRTKFQEYELSFLSKKDTENLIDSILGQEYVNLKNEDGDLICLLRELCERLAGLPLSITHAAAFIREEINDRELFDENIDCSTYKETIRTYLDNFDSKLSDPFSSQFITVDNKSAFTAIQLNLQKLLGANFNSAKPDVTAEVLAVIGHLNPDDIYLKVLDVLFGEVSVKRALIRFIKFSIITKTVKYIQEDYFISKTASYRIHRTTQKVVKALLKDICQDKVALCSLFKGGCEIKNGFKIGNMEIAKKELEEIIGRAFSKLVHWSFSFYNVCSDKECKLCRQSSSWFLPHKLLLASKEWFDSKIMISVLKILATDLKPVGLHNATLLHLVLEKTLDGELIRFLISQGLTIDAVTEQGATPLHAAIRSIEIMSEPESFLYEGLDLLISDSTVNTRDREGFTPLNLLASRCFYSDSNEIKALCLNLAQHLTKANADVNTRCNEGWAPVHWAAFNVNPDLLKLLLRFKADVNIQTNNGFTALHLAVDSACSVSSYLFDPHTRKCHECIDERIEVLSVLMSCGARIDIVNKKGETVVDIANRRGQNYLANWLQKPRETLSNFDNDVPIPTDLDKDCTTGLWIDRNSKTRPIRD